MTAFSLRSGLAVAAGLIVLALVLKAAGHAGYLGADAPTRSAMVVSALLIAWYGNVIPKVVLRSPQAIAARRVAGWAFVLCGIVTAALWAFAPLSLALPAAIGVTVAAMALSVGACVVLRGRPSPSA